MIFSLLQLSRRDLEALSVSQIPAAFKDRAEPNSMPPAFVASRALRLEAEGHPEPWSTSFLIVRDDERIVGGCGFKNAPLRGRVEVGYVVTPAARGNGAATAALRQLLDIAFHAGAREVMAEIVPMNHASARVVGKLDFAAVGSRTDEEGDLVIQWVKRSET